ncbi:uncharacterized protein LOC144954685 [Lampetra fluviatilis]
MEGNSQRLRLTDSLLSDKHRLEQQLERDSREEMVMWALAEAHDASSAEVSALKGLLKAQKVEVSSLRAEIAALGRKGGHVEPPTAARVNNNNNSSNVNASGQRT